MISSLVESLVLLLIVYLPFSSAKVFYEKNNTIGAYIMAGFGIMALVFVLTLFTIKFLGD